MVAIAIPLQVAVPVTDIPVAVGETLRGERVSVTAPPERAGRKQVQGRVTGPGGHGQRRRGVRLSGLRA